MTTSTYEPNENLQYSKILSKLNRHEMRLEMVKLAVEMKLKRYDYTTTLIKTMTPEQRQSYELTKFPMFPTSDQIMKLARVIENFIYPEPKKTDKGEPVI